MIHPEDRKYLEAERDKMYDAFDSGKAMADLVSTLAYEKGLKRGYEKAMQEVNGNAPVHVASGYHGERG